MPTTRQVLFASRPTGPVVPGNFSFGTAETPPLGDGDVLVRHIYMSVDPYMRGMMNGAVAYAAGFEPGRPMYGRVIGEVTESRNPAFPEGAFVYGMLDWAEWSVAKGGESLRIVDGSRAPLSYYLGALGFPGLTAYVGMTVLATPKAGEQVFVSAAAGAVGQIAGQLARIAGAHVVGSAGSDEKLRFITAECGFHDGFNYKLVPSVLEALRLHCPRGIDVCFENVGGATLDAVLAHANTFARLSLCGMISQYNALDPYHVRHLNDIISKRLSIHGFVVRDHAHLIDRYIDEMSGYIADGLVAVAEDISHGLDAAPAAFIGMMRGDNFGKQLVQVGTDPFRPD
ncbi:MAG: NADP-dependent oxidoreductase [Pseudomonadota bacterium]|nr:NADP-dependent oxidoreductase [Pseudomonadota bacterium]